MMLRLLMLIAAMAVYLGDCYIMNGYPIKEINQYNNIRTYCEYQGLKILPGSSFKTTDCVDCACTEFGLSCQGFGIAAGVMSMEIDGAECVAIPDFCGIIWARADDNTKDCETGKPLISEPSIVV